jgi:hypothetical protein
MKMERKKILHFLAQRYERSMLISSLPTEILLNKSTILSENEELHVLCHWA